jgi:hypothetical protein
LLWAALILTVVGNFAVVVVPIGSIELEPIGATGQRLYTPQFSVDYTRGAYSLLLGMGYAGGARYLIAYGLLAAHLFGRD